MYLFFQNRCVDTLTMDHLQFVYVKLQYFEMLFAPVLRNSKAVGVSRSACNLSRFPLSAGADRGVSIEKPRCKNDEADG